MNTCFLRTAKSPIFTLVILLTLAVSASGAPPWPGDDDCGAAADGLQMCLAPAGQNLQLTLRNVGDHDLTLNLGMMLANGRVQLPNRLAIKFTDVQGHTRLFKFGDKRYPAVAGRVDDYVVALRVGSTYTLQLTLDQFWCQETKEFSIPLDSNDDHLTAQFEGTRAAFVNSDTQGMKLMNFWLGKANSNTLMLRR